MKASWIAYILEIKYRTVYSIIRRKKLQNMKTPRGRKQKLSVRAFRRLRRQIDYNLFKHIAVITAEFNL